VVLDFLNEQLPWRNCKDNKVDEVRDIKAKCLANPEALLWRTTTAGVEQIKNIFYAIQKLDYADRPDYELIRQQLLQLLQKEEEKARQANTGRNSWVRWCELIVRRDAEGDRQSVPRR